MEQKIKLARLAVSLACRLYSTDESGERVVVTPAHVEYVHTFLNRQYDMPHFGFDIFSRRKRSAETIKDLSEVNELLTKWGVPFIHQLLDGYQINVKFIEECNGEMYDEAKINLAKLLRNGCVTKKHNFYIKTPAFIKCLKDFLDAPQNKEEEY